jgi:hypothetical protein
VVEFALTLPVMLLVVMGIVELSLLMHRVHQVTRAARDACRLGAGVLEGTDPTGDEIELAAEDQALAILAAQAVDCGGGCDVDATWFENDGWMLLRVDIEVPYDPVPVQRECGPGRGLASVNALRVGNLVTPA